MKKKNIFLIVCLFSANILYSQIINKEPLSARLTGYKIDVTLNPETTIVKGDMDAFWVNSSTDIVPDIRLHLYMNAFRSSKTTFYTESGGSPGRRESDPGWIEINSFTDKEGLDLTPGMKFISPDDDNPDDQTVLQVFLPKPANPGDTVFVKINFETKLPSNIRRTGYNDDFFFVAQWFPKFGVYEPAGMRYATVGGWNCHQFHAHSEFYSNHSVYDVSITLPEEYVVGSGGLLISETEIGEGKKTLVYRAEDIVDFAWTAWPGYAVFKDSWEHVDITLLIPGDRTEQVERQFIAVKHALEYLTENVGPYPWPHLTFVDPPAKGSGAGGMEYTTLFTSMSFYRMPEWIHIPEMVTIHEFGHAYFMGILASNEFEEPWLDEGINSFWEERIVDHYYGRNSGLIDHPLIKIADASYSRITYVTSPEKQIVSNNEYAWDYPLGTYSMMSYMKATTWLFTLMGIVGEETTNEIFRQYYKKWAFKHPCGRDFINVVNEVVTEIHGDRFGPDMNWFFNQTLYGTGICDYRVAGFQNRKLETTDEAVENTKSGDTISTDTLPEYRSVAQFERRGELMFPVDILIHFDNGDEILESWDGKSRYYELEYTGNRKIDWVKIDPEFRIRMDVNYINNSMTVDPDRLPIRRLTNKFISFIQFFISIISL